MSDKMTIPASAPIASPARIVQVDMPEFDTAFGEPFSQTLDLTTWTQGEDLHGAAAGAYVLAQTARSCREGNGH